MPPPSIPLFIRLCVLQTILHYEEHNLPDHVVCQLATLLLAHITRIKGLYLSSPTMNMPVIHKLYTLLYTSLLESFNHCIEPKPWFIVHIPGIKLITIYELNHGLEKAPLLKPLPTKLRASLSPRLSSFIKVDDYNNKKTTGIRIRFLTDDGRREYSESESFTCSISSSSFNL